MPLILISNDDGITMEGIHRLVDAVSELGTVIVAAPDGPRSGGSSAISCNTMLMPKRGFSARHPKHRVLRLHPQPFGCRLRRLYAARHRNHTACHRARTARRRVPQRELPQRRCRERLPTRTRMPRPMDRRICPLHKSGRETFLYPDGKIQKPRTRSHRHRPVLERPRLRLCSPRNPRPRLLRPARHHERIAPTFICQSQQQKKWMVFEFGSHPLIFMQFL